MTKNVIWSPLSESDFESILFYLRENWSNRIIKNFIDQVENLVIQISNNPKQFPLVNKKRKVRKCVITKHNTIFYRETRSYVEILRIFDTRQDPKKKQYE